MANDLWQRDPAELETLLVGRPDLVTPACRDLNSLARLCADPFSLRAALATLDTVHLGALTVAAVCAPPVSTDSVSAALGRDSKDLVHRLWQLALLWGNPAQWRISTSLRDLVLNPRTGPAVGLIYPRVAHYAAEPSVLVEVLAAAPPAALRILDDLMRVALIARVPRLEPSNSGHAYPGLLWLLERQIVVPVGANRVAVPAELVSILKSERPPIRQIVQFDPPRRGQYVQQGAVDEAGAQAATATVELTTALCHEWTVRPAQTVSNGGLAVRDLNRTSAALGVPSEDVRLLILAASSAGLIGVRDADRPGERAILIPTCEFDAWMSQTPAVRWAILAHGWSQMGYRTHMTRGERQVPNALRPDSWDWRVAHLRNLVLQLCTDPRYLPEKTDMSSTAVSRDLMAVLDMVSWSQPGNYIDERADAVSSVLTQATSLGVMAKGAMTTAGAALLAASGRPQSFSELAKRAGPAAAALQPWLAPLVDSIILQADLTIVVPGPPQAELAAFLDSAAAVESRGIGRILRVTPDSLRVAMAAGWTEPALLGAFQRWSATGVPQPLQVLIRDTARTYDQLRSGATSAYLRSDDQCLLAQILADDRLSGLGFFPLAPTVLACRTDHTTMMAGLVKQGYRPVVESPQGQVLDLGSRRRSVRPLRTPSRWNEPPSRERIRRAAAALAESPPAVSTCPMRPKPCEELSAPVDVADAHVVSAPVADVDVADVDVTDVDVADVELIQLLIRDALTTGRPLRLTHVRNDGEVGSSVVIPTTLTAGTLRAVVAEDADTGRAGRAKAPAAAEVAPAIAVPLMRILTAAPVTFESG